MCRIRSQAAKGEPRFRSLERAMYGCVGVTMLDRARSYVIAYLVQVRV
jgi:hypothetical protein